MNFEKDVYKQYLLNLIESPLKTLRETGRGFYQKRVMTPQARQVKQASMEAPLLLQVETTNVCNALCIFCACPNLKRQKGVMNLPLFEKIIDQYIEMGGGPVSLTPLMGDPLLDPHLLQRLEILKSRPDIKQISFTTNAINLGKYTDEDVRCLLGSLYYMQVSVGGLDSATYEKMYGVNTFAQVRESMERLMKIREEIPNPAHLTFAFRTNDRHFEKRNNDELDSFRQRNVFVSHICSYANYAGAVESDKNNNLVVLRGRGERTRACLSLSLSLAVCWDGAITACGCADYEADQLPIGNVADDHLADVWPGRKRTGFLGSFGKSAPPRICRNCSAYTPETYFGSACFKGIQPHGQLPLDYYRQIMA